MPRLIRKMAMMLACALVIETALSVTNVYAHDHVTIKAQTTKQSTSAKGDISTTIRFDSPFAYDKVKEQNIKVVLKKGDENIVEVQLGEQPKAVKNTGNYTVDIIPRNTQGVEITTEEIIGSYHINIKNLELGEYQLVYEGNGYKTYTSQTINLKDYSKNVTVGTGDGTFSYGDIDGDQEITEDDLKALEGYIREENHDKDINGDGKVDISELTYVKHQIQIESKDTSGEMQTDLAAIVTQKVLNAAEQSVKDAKLTIDNGASVSDLFTGTNDITIRKASDEEELKIPLDLGQDGIEAQVIEFVSPSGEGGLGSGTVVIDYMEGNDWKQKVETFNTTVEGIQFLGRSQDKNTVVINLGKKVPVKRVTISVDKVLGEDGNADYVVMEKVSFVKDIVSNVSSADKTMVKNVKATAKDKEVVLTWDAVPNVEGYKILYGETSNHYTKELNVDTTYASIKGLENLKTYYFVVKATSGEWMGTASEECKATPQPSAAPKSPDFLKTQAMNGGLTLSWGKTEDATYYKVFYKKEAETEYTQFKPAGNSEGKITATSAVIGGLENNTSYDLYVIAGNTIGESKPSEVATGKPEQITLEGPVLPTKNKIDKDNIKDITLTFTPNVAMEFYPNGFNTKYVPTETKDGMKNLVDGNYATHWTARRWWESTQINTTFENVYEMDHVVYVPRVDGRYTDSIDTYNIVVWEENDDLSKAGKTIASNKKCIIRKDAEGRRYAVLTFPKTKVKKIAVSVAQWAGSPTNISASELAFYEYYSLDDDIKALFADNTFTTLASGVKLENINALRAQLDSKDSYYVDTAIFEDELNLAEALLNKDESKLGIMKKGLVSIDASSDVKKINDWSPLGIVGFAGKQMVVYADIPQGETVQLIPTQYYSEANSLSGTAIELRPGRNIIDITKIGSLKETAGGSFYYRYSGKNGDKVKLHIRSFNNSVVEIPTLELYDWDKLEKDQREAKIEQYIKELTAYQARISTLKDKETNPLNSTEISGRNILLSLPADTVFEGLKGINRSEKEQVQQLYNNMLAWEEVIEVVHTTYGLDNPSKVLNSRQNIRYMRMFGKAFMYAAGSHIGVGYGSTSALVQGKPTSLLGNATENGLFGWGIGHEIGHNMDRIGKAEITNNIYSLMLQTYDGNNNILKSRLELSNKYQEIYKKVAIGDKGMANDVFTQLGMYWQLHLAYDGKKDTDNGPLSFYNQLFKVYDSGQVDNFKGDDQFAVAASIVADKNLTEFFTKWGVELSEAAKKEMQKHGVEERKIQYLTDESRRYRLNGGQGITDMAFTATAAVSGKAQASTDEGKIEETNDNKVKITINIDKESAKNLLGFEIFREDEQIAFITGTTYEDVIGSANNKAFKYEVRAIDALGRVVNKGTNEGKVYAGQVRIEHDNIISSDLYDIKFVKANTGAELTTGLDVTTKSAIVITFKEQMPVTGIKVKAKKDSTSPMGKFTVVVGKQGEKAIDYTVAKDSNFSENAVVDESKFITYFNKPGASSKDTRIWTYDAKEIRIIGDNIDANFLEQFEVQPLGYPGDNVAFEDYKVGIMGQDYTYDTQEGKETIKAGTLVVLGAYRGDPIYNTIRIVGRYAEHTSLDNEVKYVDRPINGEVLMFAEVPEDGETSDISDGFFLFIPDIQKEQKLQGDCSQVSVLPTEIMAKMYRYDNVDHNGKPRVTSTTLWYTTPSYESMPKIILNQGETSLMKESMYEKN